MVKNIMQPDMLKKLLEEADKQINAILSTRGEMEDNITVLEQQMEEAIEELNSEVHSEADIAHGEKFDFAHYSQEILARIQARQHSIHDIERQIEELQTDLFAMYAEKNKYQQLLAQHETQDPKAVKEKPIIT